MGKFIEPFSITAVAPFKRENPNVGDGVEVYWPKDDSFNRGTVTSLNQETQEYHVNYDDGDSEHLIFKKEIWRTITAKVNVTNPVQEIGESIRPDYEFDVQETRTVTEPIDKRFHESALSGIQGLLSRGSYEVVKPEQIPADATILKSRMENAIKTDEQGREIFKSRLIIQGHLDPGKATIVNDAPTVLRSSIRLILSLSQMYDFPLWTRVVKQAFTQSAYQLARQVLIKPPNKPDLMPMMNHPPGSYLRALKPIYGLTESPGYWWKTYRIYHGNDLGMIQSVMDPCIFYKNETNKFLGAVGTLVGDTIGTGSKVFVNEEETKCKGFDVKEKQTSFPLKFGGLCIQKA